MFVQQSPAVVLVDQLFAVPNEDPVDSVLARQGRITHPNSFAALPVVAAHENHRATLR